MPTVKTSTVFFGGREFKMRVNVDTKGVFRIKLPAWSFSALGQEKIEKNTLDAAVREFEHLRIKFSEILQEKRKVIQYMFYIKDMVNGGFHSGLVPGRHDRDDMAFCMGKGVVVCVRNQIETVHRDADGKTIRKSYDFCKEGQPYPSNYRQGKFGGRDKELRVLEWTQEREDWFMSLCEAMDLLVGKVRELDEDQQKLLEAVNNRVLLTYSEGDV